MKTLLSVSLLSTFLAAAVPAETRDVTPLARIESRTPTRGPIARGTSTPARLPRALPPRDERPALRRTDLHPERMAPLLDHPEEVEMRFSDEHPEGGG